MLSFSDQTGRIIYLPRAPQRILSLVPSQTELLADLELDEKVVGITKFCVHPSNWFESKKRVGGTKSLHIDKIHSLQPEVIIANKEENVKEQVEELRQSYPVWVSDVHDLATACDMICDIGKLTDTENKAAWIIGSIRFEFSTLDEPTNRLTAAYLIWNKPYLSVGGDTFISNMMLQAGFQNVFSDRSRYPEISIDDLVQAGPALILLSSEPFPFRQKHKDELSQQLSLAGWTSAKIIFVDGEMFSWYGSRLRLAPRYFKQLWQQVCP
jgi:ABC-type Fe3+-hydroxamate transport system substrate-binding protein